ncbi:MAG: fumarylacetoacetate hydrolase family protein [Rubrivivax sp.]
MQNVWVADIDRLLPLQPFPRTVYCALLNDRAALDALGDAVHQPPYKAPPRAPVLGIKPHNCFVGDGQAIVVPRGVDELQMGPSLGLVIGRSLRRVSEAEALGGLAGYTVCNDVCVPHASHYRPSLRFRCRDTFLPIGPRIVAAHPVADPDALNLVMQIDGDTVFTASTGGMQRSAARLLADVSGFMTLLAGDVLLLGTPFGAPRARVGQRVSITIEGVGTLTNPLVAEGAA